MTDLKALSAKWLDPTPEMLERADFEAIWQVIKSWDINVPAAYGGYMGATGNHVRAILDALPSIPDTRAWAPIATAPKDGTPILAYEPGLDPCVVSRKDGLWIGAAGYDFAPTHWMPLPSPPVADRMTKDEEKKD